MKLEEIAALGTYREAGESLASWLRAGPLGSAVLSYFPECRSVEIDNEDIVASCTICPSCSTSRGRYRRLYVRSAWSDPRVVVCTEHARPLQLVRPALLGVQASRRAPLPEFRDLARWITRWQTLSPCISARRLTTSRSCLEDVVLDVVTKDQAGTIASTWQWRLWVDGWPVPSSPRAPPQFQLADMPRLADRLALVGTVWRICQLLRGEFVPHWPPIRLEEVAYAQMENCIQRFEPSLVARLSLVLRR